MTNQTGLSLWGMSNSNFAEGRVSAFKYGGDARPCSSCRTVFSRPSVARPARRLHIDIRLPHEPARGVRYFQLAELTILRQVENDGCQPNLCDFDLIRRNAKVGRDRCPDLIEQVTEDLQILRRKRCIAENETLGMMSVYLSWVPQQPDNGFEQHLWTGGFGNYDPVATGWTVMAVPTVQDERDTLFR